MAEVLSTTDLETQDQRVDLEKVTKDLGKVSVLEALAIPSEEHVTPSMTWQSAWANREDR